MAFTDWRDQAMYREENCYLPTAPDYVRLKRAPSVISTIIAHLVCTLGDPTLLTNDYPKSFPLGMGLRNFRDARWRVALHLSFNHFSSVYFIRAVRECAAVWKDVPLDTFQQAFSDDEVLSDLYGRLADAVDGGNSMKHTMLLVTDSTWEPRIVLSESTLKGQPYFSVREVENHPIATIRDTYVEITYVCHVCAFRPQCLLTDSNEWLWDYLDEDLIAEHYRACHGVSTPQSPFIRLPRADPEVVDSTVNDIMQFLLQNAAYEIGLQSAPQRLKVGLRVWLHIGHIIGEALAELCRSAELPKPQRVGSQVTRLFAPGISDFDFVVSTTMSTKKAANRLKSVLAKSTMFQVRKIPAPKHVCVIRLHVNMAAMATMIAQLPEGQSCIQEWEAPGVDVAINASASVDSMSAVLARRLSASQRAIIMAMKVIMKSADFFRPGYLSSTAVTWVAIHAMSRPAEQPLEDTLVLAPFLLCYCRDSLRTWTKSPSDEDNKVFVSYQLDSEVNRLDGILSSPDSHLEVHRVMRALMDDHAELLDPLYRCCECIAKFTDELYEIDDEDSSSSSQENKKKRQHSSAASSVDDGEGNDDRQSKEAPSENGDDHASGSSDCDSQVGVESVASVHSEDKDRKSVKKEVTSEQDVREASMHRSARVDAKRSTGSSMAAHVNQCVFPSDPTQMSFFNSQSEPSPPPFTSQPHERNFEATPVFSDQQRRSAEQVSPENGTPSFFYNKQQEVQPDTRRGLGRNAGQSGLPNVYTPNGLTREALLQHQARARSSSSKRTRNDVPKKDKHVHNHPREECGNAPASHQQCSNVGDSSFDTKNAPTGKNHKKYQEEKNDQKKNTQKTGKSTKESVQEVGDKPNKKQIKKEQLTPSPVSHISTPLPKQTKNEGTPLATATALSEGKPSHVPYSYSNEGVPHSASNPSKQPNSAHSNTSQSRQHSSSSSKQPTKTNVHITQTDAARTQQPPSFVRAEDQTSDLVNEAPAASSGRCPSASATPSSPTTLFPPSSSSFPTAP